MTPEKIKGLQDQYKAKKAELNEILQNANPTGELLTKGEALDKDLKKLKGDIDEATAEAARFQSLRDEVIRSEAWEKQAAPGLFSGAPASRPGFKSAGSEDGGYAGFIADKNGKLSQVDECGPGSFGPETWELMKSFEYKKDFMQYLRKGNRFLDSPLAVKTLQEGVDGQGGVFAPAEMINRIIGREPAPTRLEGLVQSITTGRDMVEMPRLQYSADDKYTTGFRATSTGEIPSDGTGAMATVNDANLFGVIQIPVFTWMLNGSLTNNMIEDSAFPLQSWMESKLGETIDLLKEDMILNGNGVNQPFGILNGANAANNGTTVRPDLPEVVLSGAAGAVSTDLLDDLQTALAPQYENDRTCWIMNKKSAYRALRKLKDGQNRPLFTTGYNDSGLASARGRTLLGDPIIFSLFMADVGAANFPIVYGDPNGYYLANRLGLSIQVLNQTRAKINQIELVGRVRFGGRTVEPWRLKIGKSNNS